MIEFDTVHKAFGPKRVLTVIMTLWSATAVMTGAALGFGTLFGARFYFANNILDFIHFNGLFFVVNLNNNKISVYLT